MRKILNWFKSQWEKIKKFFTETNPTKEIYVVAALQGNDLGQTIGYVFALIVAIIMGFPAYMIVIYIISVLMMTFRQIYNMTLIWPTYLEATI